METNNLTAPIAVEKDRNTLTIELMNRMKLHGMVGGKILYRSSDIEKLLDGCYREARTRPEEL